MVYTLVAYEQILNIIIEKEDKPNFLCNSWEAAEAKFLRNIKLKLTLQISGTQLHLQGLRQVLG